MAGRLLCGCAGPAHLRVSYPPSALTLWTHLALLSAATSAAGCIPKCVQVLKPGGHLSHIMNQGTDQEALGKLQEGGGGPTASLTLVAPNGAQLQEVFELIAAGKVKLEVAQVGCGP